MSTFTMVARCLAAVYAFGVLLSALWAINFSLKKPRNFAVSLTNDVLSRVSASLVVALFWPFVFKDAITSTVKFNKAKF